jgi:hypothetical protein
MVEVGLRLAASANFGTVSASGEDANGPLVEGETVPLVVVRPRTTPTVMLRPVGPEGLGFAGARPRGCGADGSAEQRTGVVASVMVEPDGVLRTDVGEPVRKLDPLSSSPPPEPKPIRELHLLAFDGNMPKWRAVVAVPPTTLDVIDLGTR